MDGIKALLTSLGILFGIKELTLENAVEQIKQAMAAKDSRINELEKQLSDQKNLAADGKAWRDDLVGKYVACKAKLGEVNETPEAQNAVKAVAGNYPIDFLKSEVACLEKRVAEKFPAEGQLKGSMPDKKETSADGASNEPGDKWKSAKDNPLIPKE